MSNVYQFQQRKLHKVEKPIKRYFFNKTITKIKSGLHFLAFSLKAVSVALFTAILIALSPLLFAAAKMLTVVGVLMYIVFEHMNMTGTPIYAAIACGGVGVLIIVLLNTVKIRKY